jgi:hydroxysqualene dehydroxylase
MKRLAGGGRIHVVGAGLAGLSAAISTMNRGMQIIVSEASKFAGGRCRSYHDSLLDVVIDNGNYLILSGNSAIGRYLRAIGAEDRLTRPAHLEFSFFDCGTGHGWTLKPNDSRIPWSILKSGHRVPGTSSWDYLKLADLMRHHPGRRVDEVIRCDGTLWAKCLRPMLVSALNTAPEEATADLAGAVIRETLWKDDRHARPLLATPNLAAAFVDPALDCLRQNGSEVRFGRSLRAVRFEKDRLAGLIFDDGEEILGCLDSAILAIPPWTIQELLPGVTVPDTFRAIVNAHFRFVAPANAPPMLGLVSGTADWLFAFHDRVSVTVSAADYLLDVDNDDLALLLWRNVIVAYDLSGPVPPARIVKEKRATFAHTPAQELRRPSVRSPWANLFLAGDWTNTGLPATIEGALRSGENAATIALSSRGYY